MSSDAEAENDELLGEGAVSGNQASIPAHVRERADIEDGDSLRWRWKGGELSVEVIRRRSGVFEDFDGFEGRNDATDHDAVGVEPAGELDASPRDEEPNADEAGNR
ncbi:AbrB/MazE/SpoVT family DNA-binding domain-containing protein [Halomarina pelagica]|uniref:AbrB/MazE/SpoVT family DNA-binding domain-containing protein n=1 Tax=Halomarina pelagica TaxID=2961599 RepID=UPI0020C22D80|nr:AbrB/MazE/SpoVT family DNA-binding domain-containing protein [Halomarina sp. BND7]